MQVGRAKAAGKAIMVINIDSAISADTLKKISSIPGIIGQAKLVKF
jgi:nitrate reductase NapAB chaperone NapD